jgi:hypothetical protein
LHDDGATGRGFVTVLGAAAAEHVVEPATAAELVVVEPGVDVVEAAAATPDSAELDVVEAAAAALAGSVCAVASAEVCSPHPDALHPVLATFAGTAGMKGRGAVGGV